MTTHTVPLEIPDRGALGPCQFKMKQPPRRDRPSGPYGFARRWSKPCPNAGVLVHRGRVYCAAHAPAVFVNTRPRLLDDRSVQSRADEPVSFPDQLQRIDTLDLYQYLEGKGIKLRLRDGQIHWCAPFGVMTPHDVREIKSHDDELRECLVEGDTR